MKPRQCPSTGCECYCPSVEECEAPADMKINPVPSDHWSNWERRGDGYGETNAMGGSFRSGR